MNLRGKHTSTNDIPGLVGVSIIADDAGSNHEYRDEKAVVRGIMSDNEPCLESLQQIECSKSHRGRESCAMESIGDEVGKGRGLMGDTVQISGTATLIVGVWY